MTKTPKKPGCVGRECEESIIFRLPSIPAALEFRREAYGWTARQMAKAIGLANTHYSEVVHGKRQLPYKAACKAFEIGVPYTVLLQTAKTKRAYEDSQRRAAKRIAARGKEPR